jgi:hypothetical protein
MRTLKFELSVTVLPFEKGELEGITAVNHDSRTSKAAKSNALPVTALSKSHRHA